MIAALKKVAVNTSLVAVSILAVLIGAELVTRIVAPQLAPARADRVDFWEYDAQLGWANRPNQTGRYVHPAFDTEVSINSQGLRDDEFSADDRGEKLILVLGDSFGWGVGVDHEERFDTVLEEKRPGWNFVNSSVSGYGTDQQYLWLTRNLENYQPDAVLLLFYQNDFTNNFSSLQYWYFKPRFVLENNELKLTNVPVPESTAEQEMQRFFMGRTYLFNYFYMNIVYPINIRRSLSPSNGASLSTVESQESFSSFDITGALLSAIKEYCEANDAEFILVSVPSEPRYQEALLQLSREKGMNYLPLDDAFASLKPSDYKIRRDNHWNSVGHKIAADAIDAYLRERDLF